MLKKFRVAEPNDILPVWDMLQHGILRRKIQKSNQWQDGYPNIEVIKKDIENRAGYVLTVKDEIIGYCAIFINEPEYEKIIGEWLSNGKYVVFHRIVISEKHIGKGYSKIILEFIETFALDNKIYSIKADTNYDNYSMLKIFEKMNYIFCGVVYFRGSPREAFEKLLSKT